MAAALAETDPAVSELEIGNEESAGGATAAPPSDTALVLDDWGLRRGREVLEESDRLRGVLEVPNTELLSPADAKAAEERIKQAQLLTADFHASAFEPETQLAERPVNERLSRYLKQLFETNEFKALHNETQLDEVASEIAASSFAEQWVALAKTEEPTDDFKKDMQCLAAAGAATSEAREEVSGMRDACSAMGIGGNGAAGGQLSSKQLAGMFKRVRGNRTLRRICELAGRYRMFAQAQQRKKTLHGRDDVVGVVLDGDIGRLLPHELVQLADEDLELDIERRIVEREAMCREYRGIENQARGPIVVVVDESGSMSGEPICTAKAMALALSWVARQQKRWYCLVGFSGGTNGCYCVAPPKGLPRFIDYENGDEATPAAWVEGETGIMDWLEHFYSGGTDADVPLVELPKHWDSLGAPKGKTDIIVITDAILHVPPAVASNFMAWKAKEQVKLISLVINGEPGDIGPVSDKVYRVRSLGLDEEGVADALGV